MILTVKNLGPVKEAEIDLRKDLIVFSGKNNTGKTYMSYLLYGIFENVYFLKIEAWTKNPLKKEDFFKDKIFPNLNDIKLNEIFPNLDISSLEFSINLTQNSLKEIKKINKKDYFFSKIQELSKSKAQKYNSLLSLSRDINTKETDIIFLAYFPVVYFFPAERSAIHIFYKDLVEQRAKKAELLYQNQDIYLPIYPKPVRDYIFFVNDFGKYKKQKSDFSALADRLTNFLGGKIQLGTYDELLLELNGQSKRTLEMPVTSSTVKSLAGLEFYFRHIAQENNVILIDEPELNLHPDNQRKLTRILVNAVNSGIKIIMSTHSDYIIREINNLIMLAKDDPKACELRKRLGYTDKEVISHKRVGAYLFLEDKVKKLKVEETGFEVETIDTEINSQNEIAQEIYYQLFD